MGPHSLQQVALEPLLASHPNGMELFAAQTECQERAS